MNRRGFLGALLAAPVAVAAAVEVAKATPPVAEGFTAEQLAYAGNAAVEFYLKNEPVNARYYWHVVGDPRSETEIRELLRENMECLQQSLEENILGIS